MPLLHAIQRVDVSGTLEDRTPRTVDGVAHVGKNQGMVKHDLLELSIAWVLARTLV